MKKVLFFAAVLAVASMTFVACGKKENKEAQEEQTTVTAPEEGEAVENNAGLQAFADMINAKIAEDGDTDITVAVNGNDLVFVGTVDESDLPNGMSVKSMLDMLTASGDAGAQMMIDNMIGDMDEEDRVMMNILRSNKSNLVFRFTGKQSGEVGEYVIRYDLLPE